MNSQRRSAMQGTPGPIYLDYSEISPGDVLLTRGKGTTSAAIAAVTGGRFSHAALVLNRQFRFESDDSGVGSTYVAVDRIEIAGHDRRLLSQLTDVEDALLLRHPDLPRDERSQTAAAEKLLRALQPLSGKQYPNWQALASAAGGRTVSAVAAVVLKCLDAIQSGTLFDPGPFCSQLVAAAWRDAFHGMYPCFSPERDPATVSPNSFCSSRFQTHTAGLRHADPAAPLDDKALALLTGEAFPKREYWTGGLVELRRNAAALDPAYERVRDLTK